MINRVILVGRLTRNPELKYTANGIANLQFSLAVNRSYTGANGEKQADFINCMAWRGTAENMTKFLKKGALIGIEGRIETSSYHLNHHNKKRDFKHNPRHLTVLSHNQERIHLTPTSLYHQLIHQDKAKLVA